MCIYHYLLPFPFPFAFLSLVYSYLQQCLFYFFLQFLFTSQFLFLAIGIVMYYLFFFYSPFHYFAFSLIPFILFYSFASLLSPLFCVHKTYLCSRFLDVSHQNI